MAADSQSVAVLAEYVLPNYVARYASLALPMAMMFGKGDRLLDYRARRSDEGRLSGARS